MTLQNSKPGAAVITSLGSLVNCQLDASDSSVEHVNGLIVLLFLKCSCNRTGIIKLYAASSVKPFDLISISDNICYGFMAELIFLAAFSRPQITTLCVMICWPLTHSPIKFCWKTKMFFYIYYIYINFYIWLWLRYHTIINSQRAELKAYRKSCCWWYYLIYCIW